MIHPDARVRPEPSASGGAPTCWERCPAHDGKRCEVLGHRAPEGHVCAPWADHAASRLRMVDGAPATPDALHAPADRPPELGHPALLLLRVDHDNIDAGLDEYYRLGWWDESNKRWQFIDSEGWVMQTIEPGSVWLRGWLDLTELESADLLKDNGEAPLPGEQSNRERP